MQTCWTVEIVGCQNVVRNRMYESKRACGTSVHLLQMSSVRDLDSAKEASLVSAVLLIKERLDVDLAVGDAFSAWFWGLGSDLPA